MAKSNADILLAVRYPPFDCNFKEIEKNDHKIDFLYF